MIPTQTQLNTSRPSPRVSRRQRPSADWLKTALPTLAMIVACAGALVPSQPSRAEAPAKITITAAQAWLRSAPSLIARHSISVTKGQFFDVTGRTEDGAWWQLSVTPPPTATQPAAGATWLLADLGVPVSGDVKAVPIAKPSAPVPVPVPKGKTPKKPKPVKEPPVPAWIPQITPQQRAIWQTAPSVGRDPGFFTVVGDCNSQPPVYLQRLASGQFDASGLSPKLQATVQQFARSFGRVSLAAKGGFGSASMMDPSWADGGLCDPKNTGEGPFACELRVSNASIVFISLGTQEQYNWKDFEKNFRPIVEHALAKHVLPVLVTKADDIEVEASAPKGYINDIVRKVAKDYNVPLVDFYAATRELPWAGLIDEGGKNFHQSYMGMDRRILVTLQTLAAITGK